MIQKAEWRQHFIAKRKALSEERRKEAIHSLEKYPFPSGNILSFSPFRWEIDIASLNKKWKNEGRLFLMPYRLESLFEIPMSQVHCILVPGLAFDKDRYRLGYGKGFYDRFLINVTAIPIIGIGFKEQYTDVLPRDAWDVPMTELVLV